MLSGFEKTWVR